MEKKVYRSRFGWLFVGVLLSSQVYAQTFYLASTYGSLSNVGLEHNCQRHILA